MHSFYFFCLSQRYHTPTRSKSRSASVEERGSSETPPHWKEEMKRTKIYQPPSIERWSKGDKYDQVFSFLTLNTSFPSICFHASFGLTDWMTIPQADGTTEATLRGPSLQSTPQTAAWRGPASAANRRRRRRNLNTRKRPKSGNITRRRVPRANIKTSQMEKGLCLQRKGSENLVR